MTDVLITTQRDPRAHERAEVPCSMCGRAMHVAAAGVTFFNAAGFYSPAPKVVTTWRCGTCGKSMQLWEGK